MGWTGQNIKTLAKERGFTLVTLAGKIGVSRQAVNDWIKGQVPKGNHLISLCRHLQVTPDSLFFHENNSSITVPAHRTRKGAKVTSVSQNEAKELAKQYSLLLRNAPVSEIVPVIRLRERSKKNAKKLSMKLREMGGLKMGMPPDYGDAFNLLSNLGIVVIFRSFPEKLKSYAFYTKIHGHRVVFINNSTNVIDLIFPLLHEAVHAVRDEEISEETYDLEEDKFCDDISNHIQFPDEYVELVNKAIRSLTPGSKINKLKAFGKKHSHSLFGIEKRLKSINHNLDMSVGGADTNFKRNFNTIGEILFNSSDPGDFAEMLSSFSPKFIEIIKSQLEQLTDRKLGELLGLESNLDANAIRGEFSKVE